MDGVAERPILFFVSGGVSGIEAQKQLDARS
jgi:hypothetical protein